MGKIPKELRQKIADSIKKLRLIHYPGRGGGKKCAAAFGVSPQQWSPWERGMRTPDEDRLDQIATFFDTTVEDIRRGIDTRDPSPPPEQHQHQPHQTMGLSELVETSPSIFHLLDQKAYNLTHNNYSKNQATMIFMFLDGMKMHCLSKAKLSSPTPERQIPLAPSPDIAHQETEKPPNAAISHNTDSSTESGHEQPHEENRVPGAPPRKNRYPFLKKPEDTPPEATINPEESEHDQ